MADNANGKAKLIADIKHQTYQTLYIISGEETYLKEYYLNQLKEKMIEETFRDFNLFEFDGKQLTPEQLQDTIDSYPAMSEKKLIIIKDFDLFKPPAAFAEVLPTLLADLPEYICVVFYYDLLDGKPDKRTKLYKTLWKSACFAEFAQLDDRELATWIVRRVQALNCTISPENLEYMIFLCGHSMTNLIGEIEKAAAHTTTGEIKRYNIDAVCSRALEAVVFDLSDALTAGKFEQAIRLVEDLLAQKNNEIMIFTVITRHIQRLYAAKLFEQTRAGEQALYEAIGSKSPFYAKKMQQSARKISLDWLRQAACLCAATDAELKGSVVEKEKQIELCLLQMAALNGASS